MTKVWWAVVLAAAVSVLLITHAWGHDWYEAQCCSNRDCHPVDQTDLEEIDKGCWRQISTGLKFCGPQVRPSQDKRWHVCHSPTPTPVPYCVYIQQGS